MKKLFFAGLLFVMVLISASTAVLAQEEEPQKEPQTLAGFGDELCGIMKSNPAGMIRLVPLRFVVRAALASEMQGEEGLYNLIHESGLSMDDLIDNTLEESGMLKEGAGAEFFGETPVDTCSWSDPEKVGCEDMFETLEMYGLMNGSVPTTFETMVNASAEQGLQDCAMLHVVSGEEDLNMALLMFDNAWYISGYLGDAEEPEE